MNLPFIKRIALKILATGIDRDNPVYIVLKGDDKAEVQQSGQPVKEYRFYRKHYKQFKTKQHENK